jgi:hypothetical protein
MRRPGWQCFFAALLIIGAKEVVMTVPQAPVQNSLARFLPLQIRGWKADAKDQSFNPETIFDYIDGAGEVYRAYNFRQLLSRRYGKEGQADIFADFFDMGSPADAFGVFTHDLDGDDLGIGQGCVYKSGLLSFWQDKYFVSLYSDKETAETKEDLAALGKEISTAIGRRGPKPRLLDILPSEFSNEKSVRYFYSYVILNYHFFVSSENVLRLDATTEGLLARMADKGRKEALLVVKYSDAPKAAGAYRNFLKVYMPDAQEPGFLQTEDKTWTVASAFGDFIAVVFHAPSGAAARETLKQVEKRAQSLGET